MWLFLMYELYIQADVLHDGVGGRERRVPWSSESDPQVNHQEGPGRQRQQGNNTNPRNLDVPALCRPAGQGLGTPGLQIDSQKEGSVAVYTGSNPYLGMYVLQDDRQPG